MPNVKQGSIIELSYTIRSDYFFNFREWYFQRTIPTQWSEYNVSIPEYYRYQRIAQGYIPFYKNEENTTNDPNGYTVENFKWVMKDVPAFKNEPFMTTQEDYISKIEFELATIDLPGRYIEHYMNTWEEITKDLLDHEFFGLELKKKGTVKQTVASLLDGTESELQKVEIIYKYVKDNVQWNESWSVCI